MLASEARRLSEVSDREQYDGWLLGVLKKIEQAAIDRERSVYIYIGEGSYHNKNFAKEIKMKEKILHEKGYIVSLQRRTGWGSIFGGTFDYYFEVKW